MTATTNQIIAMLFPLLAVVAAWGVAFHVKKSVERERRRFREYDQTTLIKEATAGVDEVKEAMASQYTLALDEAERLIRSAEREIQRARSLASQ